MLPSNHRVDHEPVFISPLDDCWDMERINREERQIAGLDKVEGEDAPPCPWKNINEHPVTRYWSGKSRCDLATVRTYLLPDKRPTQFTLARLSLNAWTAVVHLEERGAVAMARNECVRYGLTGIVDGPIKLSGSSPLSDDDMMAVRRLLGDDKGWKMLAHAIREVNRELGPAELFA
jgi:hypothetical protein